MSKPLVILLAAEIVLFLATMALANREKTRVAGEYVGIAFHLLLLPIVAAFPGGVAGQGSGVAWVVCDVVASVTMIWTVRAHAEIGQAIANAIRMAGHLFAAVWVALVSVALGGAAMPVGVVLALGFAAYTLAAGRMPQKALAVPGLLLVAWLALLARHVAQLTT